MSPRADALCIQITELLANRLGLEIPSPDTDLFDLGILDSMSFVELLLQLEKDFGIRFALAEIEIDNFRSIRGIADFIASRMMEESAAA